MTLLVDGKQVADGKAPGGPFSVGNAGRGAVGDYTPPDPFDGKVTNVQVKATAGK